MLEFYYARDTCSLASHIALVEAGAPVGYHRLDIDAQHHHSQTYLDINPKGRVPTLITPHGPLTETPAILAYIAQAFPDAKLAPLDDVFLFAKVQEFNSFMASTLHVAHAHRMRGHRWVDDEASKRAMQKKVPETVAAAFAYIEREFLSGQFVLGEQYSIADPYLFTFAQWMEADGVDPRDFPKVMAHRDLMAERPSVKSALKEQFSED